MDEQIIVVLDERISSYEARGDEQICCSVDELMREYVDEKISAGSPTRSTATRVGGF